MLTFQVHCTSAKNRNCPQTTVIYYLPISKNGDIYYQNYLENKKTVENAKSTRNITNT